MKEPSAGLPTETARPKKSGVLLKAVLTFDDVFDSRFSMLEDPINRWTEFFSGGWRLGQLSRGFDLSWTPSKAGQTPPLDQLIPSAADKTLGSVLVRQGMHEEMIWFRAVSLNLIAVPKLRARPDAKPA